MNLDSPNELFLEGVARGTERMLLSPEFAELLAEKVAERIALYFELLTPAAAAALLDVTTATLQINFREWGLDKSVAFGATNPRYFLSQVIERAQAKVVTGKAENGKRKAELKAA